jgi:hypothetical protein
MILIKAKTLFQGKVGIREQFIKEAIKKKEGLLIRHKNESMAIPFNKLKELIAGKSAQRFPDYYGRRKPEHLIYFFFRPQTTQGAML